MLSVHLSKDAEKTLRKLPPKHARQVATKIQSLCEQPHPQDAKQLKGYAMMRVDSGEYRIIYQCDDNEVNVLLVGKRNDDEVYKKLKLKL